MENPRNTASIAYGFLLEIDLLCSKIRHSGVLKQTLGLGLKIEKVPDFWGRFDEENRGFSTHKSARTGQNDGVCDF